MNWIDILIAAGIVIAALIGWRLGLVGMAISIVGIFLGFLIGGQVSGPLASLFTESVGSAAIAAVIAYIAVGVIIFVAVQLVGFFLTKALKAMFLGWANSLAGAVLGAAAGLLVGGVIIAVLARLAFLSPGGPRGTVEVREGLRDSLVESNLVGAYLDLYDKVPAQSLGMTPGAFHEAVQELQRQRD